MHNIDVCLRCTCVINEEVSFQVLWVLLALVVIAIISLAWISTGIPPVEYYVWLVQMQVYPNRRIVQVNFFYDESWFLTSVEFAEHGLSDNWLASAV